MGSFRGICPACLRAPVSCFCQKVKPFTWGPRIVLAIHPKEARKRIGTARVVKLSLPDSLVVTGTGPELDQNSELKTLVSDPKQFPVVLYPGKGALDLSGEFQAQSSQFRALKQSLCPAGRRLAIVVVDGTWTQAKKMVRESRLLGSLPQLSLRPVTESTYTFRRQPAPHCLSTVECVHAVIERLGDLGIYERPKMRAHDSMLDVFARIVEIQVGHCKPKHGSRRYGQTEHHSGNSNRPC